MIIRKTDELKAIYNYLDNLEDVKDVDYGIRRSYKKTYVHCYVPLAGIGLWEMHKELDFNVTCSWHDPTKEMISMCFVPTNE